MRECDFLTMVAIRLAEEIPTRSLARNRRLPIEPIEAFLLNLRDMVIGRGHVQVWINREYFDAPPTSEARPINGAEAVRRVAARFQMAMKLSEDVDRTAAATPTSVAGAPVAGGSRRFGPPAGLAAATVPICTPPAAQLAAASLIRATPTGGLPSSRELGHLVEKPLQRHYRWAHPDHCVLTESNVSGPCTSQAGGTLRPDALMYTNLDLKAWSMAMATTYTGQMRVDIADLTTKEVWEIKSRREVVEGVTELYRDYLCQVNDSIRALKAAGVRGGTDLRLYSPGRSWKPFPIYRVAPTLVAWVHTELPGVLYYDLFKVAPYVVPHYAEEYAEQEARARRSLAKRDASEDSVDVPWWLPVAVVVGAVALVAASPGVAAATAAAALLIAPDGYDES